MHGHHLWHQQKSWLSSGWRVCWRRGPGSQCRRVGRSPDPDTVPSQWEAITPHRAPAQARLTRAVRP